MNTRRTLTGTTFLVASLALTLPLTGCGQTVIAGPAETQTRDIAGVDSLELRTSGDLTVTVGETESLTITAGGNVISSLTSDVQDGTLVLDSDIGVLGPNRIGYALTVRRLEQVQIVGSGSVYGSGVFGPTASVEISGSGSASFTANETADLTVRIDGSGDVTFDGVSDSLTLTVDGSGDFDGAGLRTRSATAVIAGSGSAYLHVTEDLDATVGGSGDLVYSGDPAQVRSDVTGSGEIRAD